MLYYIRVPVTSPVLFLLNRRGISTSQCSRDGRAYVSMAPRLVVLQNPAKSKGRPMLQKELTKGINTLKAFHKSGKGQVLLCDHLLPMSHFRQFKGGIIVLMRSLAQNMSVSVSVKRTTQRLRLQVEPLDLKPGRWTRRFLSIGGTIYAR